MATGSPVLGQMADRIGRRPTVLGCLIAMALGMTATSQISTLGMLAATRLFTGVGIGGMLAITNALVAEYAIDRCRSTSVAIMAAGYPDAYVERFLPVKRGDIATGRGQATAGIGIIAGSKVRIRARQSAVSPFPRQIRWPPSRTEIKVSLKNTSRPINCSMVVLRLMLGPASIASPHFILPAGKHSSNAFQPRRCSQPRDTICN